MRAAACHRLDLARKSRYMSLLVRPGGPHACRLAGAHHTWTLSIDAPPSAHRAESYFAHCQTRSEEFAVESEDRVCDGLADEQVSQWLDQPAI